MVQLYKLTDKDDCAHVALVVNQRIITTCEPDIESDEIETIAENLATALGEALQVIERPEPKNDWTWEDIVSDAKTLESPAVDPALLTPAVTAHIKLDDGSDRARFDAAAWFAQASSDEILALQSQGWEKSDESEQVAHFFASSNPEVADLIERGGALLKATRDELGFEVYVDEDEAMAWLKAHQPGVHARILCEKNDVNLLDGQAPETIGRWIWAHSESGETSIATFANEEDAALNAVKVLELELNGEPDQEAAVLDTAQLTPEVQACVRLHDGSDQIALNGAEWLARADDGQIMNLYAQECGKDGWCAEAEEAAELVARVSLDVRNFVNNEAVTSYDLGGSRHTDEQSVYLRIDEQQMLAWLKVHRPGLHAELLCTHCSVSLVQAKEPEVAGRWDWIDRNGGAASDTSFETEQAAALNAVEVLGLEWDSPEQENTARPVPR